MRKLIVSTYATLDGRVDELQDWVIPYNDDASVVYHTELLKNSDGLLLGRKTYEVFATIWPPRSGELPYVDKINSMTKHVASTTLKDLEWENSHLIDGDVVDGVAKLKQQPGQDLVMYGCHDLMHKLLEHDLIDEYRILVHPVLLGKGRSLFADGARPAEPRAHRHHRDRIRGRRAHVPTGAIERPGRRSRRHLHLRAPWHRWTGGRRPPALPCLTALNHLHNRKQNVRNAA